MASEKFCLRWNDFEQNISSAFRDIRDEKDFFDVTLACDDDSQIQAHKVIIAACSPFFRNVLRKNQTPNQNQNLVLYLKGVKYKELVSVLNFMYMGEVNVAQDDLNSFLAVAEDLRVKGLTQGSGGSERPKSESRSSVTRPRDTPASSEPPVKRSRPSAAASTPSSSSFQQQPQSYDDDIQEVVPVKSEPGTAAAAAHAQYDPGQQENQVALEEQYDESYDYGQYGEGYDDGSGMIDPNTGMPIQTADGNKDVTKQSDAAYTISLDSVVVSLDDVEKKVKSLMHIGPGQVSCTICGKASSGKNRTQDIKAHVERHLNTLSYTCNRCYKTYSTRSDIRSHKARTCSFRTEANQSLTIKLGANN